MEESTTSLSVLETLGIRLLSTESFTIFPKYHYHGTIALIGYHDKNTFIVFEGSQSVFWSIIPLKNEKFQVGNQINIYYDIIPVDKIRFGIFFICHQ